jgi:ABC-type sugar transport system ATPase subunit
MPMTVLMLQHISRRFPDTRMPGAHIPAVEDVSLRLPSGEVLAVLGPSGCGKSTLLRIIAGLLTPDRGSVLYDNVPLDQIPLAERGVGMVFQEGALIPHWEARKNIGFFLWLRHRENEVPERVRRIAQITGFGMEALLDRKPRQLSGGERQRVGVARALARDPRIFLFDEPFSNLDAKLRTQARVELRRLLNAFPVTSVYVTHDQVEAMALADRIAVMRAGRLEQIGSYQALHDNPVNLFVASFIGLHPINLFEGHAGEHQWLGPCFSGLPLRGDLPSDMRVTLGLRPAHIRLAAASTPGAVAAQVETTTPFFAERHLMLEVIAGETRFSFATPIDSGIRPGDTVHCAAEAAGALFFDSGSGQRIG